MKLYFTFEITMVFQQDAVFMTQFMFQFHRMLFCICCTLTQNASQSRENPHKHLHLYGKENIILTLE